MALTAAAPTYSVDVMRREHLLHGDGLRAILLTDDHALHVSRYPDEDAWIVDGLWRRANSYPVFVNGAGSRCTMLKVVADEYAVALLDQTAVAVLS